MSFDIRPCRDTGFRSVLKVWEQSLHLDALAPAGFIRRFLLARTL